MHTILRPASREGLVAAIPAQGYCGLKFTWTLKVLLLSGTMSVLGSLAAYAGSPGLPLDASPGVANEMAVSAGSVVGQAIEECKPWDIACLLLRPVGTVAGPPSGEDRGQDGNPGGGGDDDGGTDDGGTDDGGTDDGGTDDGGTDDGGTDDGGTDDGGTDDGGTDDGGTDDGGTDDGGTDDGGTDDGGTDDGGTDDGRPR